MKIFLSSGHSNKPGRDKGAVGNGLMEGDLTVKVRTALAAAIQQAGGTSVIDDPSLITKETVHNWRKIIGPNDVAIDIHFNSAANPTVDGVEVLVPSKPTPLELKIADKISDIISTVTGTPERGRVGVFDGVKTEGESQHTKLLWMSLPGSTVLVECQFITDKEAITTFLNKLPEIAKQIAVYLVALQKSQL